ncbi:MAG TPA: hypothetical protein VN408_22980 [Actinoplanes sp.]|nr:hypothetical protein [Actinoplanes sp.]
MSRALRIILASALAGSIIVPADAARADQGYVKYYEVTAGSSTLAKVAERFLADGRRADEIYRLNRGRKQPDGKEISAPGARLARGWLIVLPWDASGPGVRRGLLPGQTGTGSWVTDLLDPGPVHDRATGAGVVVAVLGSGVDAAAAQLAGRLEKSADITTGTVGTGTLTGAATGTIGAGGSGTAMASLVAETAPAARILPIRVIPSGRTEPASPAAVATGIEVAVSAGAAVIALGSAAPIDDSVKAAVTVAVAHGVLVVVPATAAIGDQPGMLRVASVGPDVSVTGQPPADVSAPGVDVPAAVKGGTGTDPAYAVAYTAGTAALVRSARPALGAAQVTDRIEVTGTLIAPGAPALINPVQAVTTELPTETVVGATEERTWPRTLLLIVLTMAGLASVALLTRRTLRTRFPRNPSTGQDPSLNQAA